MRRIAAAAAAELRRGGTSARVLAVLGQRRAVADQAGLGARERQANLAGALVVADGGRRLLGGGRVVLVDDLLTTGASLAEAARAVREVAEVGAGPAAARASSDTSAGTGGADDAGEGAPDGLRAAVVAASPSAFEINRN